MSNVLVALRASSSLIPSLNPKLSTDGSTIAAVVYPFGATAQTASLLDGTKLIHVGVQKQNSRLAQKASSYFSDFYERIHLIPDRLDLGNVLSDQTRYIEVWNSHISQDTLNSVTGTGTDGLALIQNQPAPTVFAANEARLYPLTVPLIGPPTIQANYSFAFSSETVSVDVVGSRIVVWPFAPQPRFKEALEWKTDVIQTFNREQRIALRQAPRQSLNHEFQLTPRQLSRAKAMATAWTHRTFGVPIWAEATHVGALSLNALSIALETANADYRTDGTILIWQDDENFLAVENTTVGAGSIGLKLALSVAFTDAWVMPLRTAMAVSGVAFSRGASNISSAKVQFVVSDNKNLEAVGSWPSYKNAPVLTDPSVLVGSFDDKIVRGVTVFDNGSGAFLVEADRAYADRNETLSFSRNGKADIWTLRQLLHYLKGKQKSFWTLSWNEDLVLLNDIATSDATISVQEIGYPQFYTITDIAIVMKNGTFYFNRITSGGQDPGGYDVLVLEANYPTAILRADVDRVCFMRRVRLDSDVLELTHDYGEWVNLSTSATEVPG